MSSLIKVIVWVVSSLLTLVAFIGFVNSIYQKNWVTALYITIDVVFAVAFIYFYSRLSFLEDVNKENQSDLSKIKTKLLFYTKISKLENEVNLLKSQNHKKGRRK